MIARIRLAFYAAWMIFAGCTSPPVVVAPAPIVTAVPDCPVGTKPPVSADVCTGKTQDRFQLFHCAVAMTCRFQLAEVYCVTNCPAP